jgi:hypothetical protein
MKSILYVGAALMISASIYGFVDYNRTSNRKEFLNMYKSKDPATVSVTIPQTNEITPKKEMVAVEKVIEETTPTVLKKINIPGKKYKTVKKKELSYKLFSRAALDERVEKPGSPKGRKN